jgi:chorismate lyase / 3-hydroxybenzoate synthase
MNAPAGLRLQYVSPAELRAAGWHDVLGVATFAAAAERDDGGIPAEVPSARINTPVLTATACVHEVWRCAAEATTGQHGRVHFRRSSDTLFGCIAVDELRLPGAAASAAGAVRETPVAHSTLHAATALAYREICATLDAQGCPHLLRVWNYLPEINRDSAGTERYRQFNTARQHALRDCGRAHSGRVPAASALGADADSPLVVYFLASRTAPAFVENPRQVSAYNYPRQYGAHSPAFSRATLLHEPGRVTLFISGTASIVGHHSLHPGDAGAQTRETLTNIQALLDQAKRMAPEVSFSLQSLACKAYVRRQVDLPAIQAQLGAALGADRRVVYLQADICRQDLLVEVEATAMCETAQRA